MSTLYLTRHGSPALGISALINKRPELIIVIPSYDEKELLNTIKSVAASSKNHRILIIPVINYPDNTTDELKLNSKDTLEEITSWAILKTQKNLQIAPVICEFPEKRSGVGTARKTGMDEAVRVYEQFDGDGIIINIDADCLVAKSYIDAIIDHFKNQPYSPAAAIHFEHTLENPSLDKAIISYELHLRYFINMQRYCLLPYAYQTVGSAMAVKSKDYQRQGGMNRRKAGEDFYFMQKMMLLGNFTEINTTVVFPSSRVSERVPFGTGRAMLEWLEKNQKSGFSYNPESFVILKTFLDLLPEIFFKDINSLKNKIPISIWEFIDSQEIHKVLLEIKKKSKNYPIFLKHFYGWFDGFKLMKYLHFSRDHFFHDQDIDYCLSWIFKNHFNREIPDKLIKILEELREIDKTSEYNRGFHSFSK